MASRTHSSTTSTKQEGSSCTFASSSKLQYANQTDAGEFQNEGYWLRHRPRGHRRADPRLVAGATASTSPSFRWNPGSFGSGPATRHLSNLLHEYALRREEVANQVLRAMATALGFDEEFFLGRRVGDKVASYARFTYDPSCPRPDLVHGLKPHTDNSVIATLLLDPDVGGLQVLKEGRWVGVPVLRRGELLVVVGDEMEIMSNAAFRAPTHRVVRWRTGRGRGCRW
ncbi:unnamed protein product [Urochloa humidicola]